MSEIEKLTEAEIEPIEHVIISQQFQNDPSSHAVNPEDVQLPASPSPSAMSDGGELADPSEHEPIEQGFNQQPQRHAMNPEEVELPASPPTLSDAGDLTESEPAVEQAKQTTVEPPLSPATTTADRDQGQDQDPDKFIGQQSDIPLFTPEAQQEPGDLVSNTNPPSSSPLLPCCSSRSSMSASEDEASPNLVPTTATIAATATTSTATEATTHEHAPSQRAAARSSSSSSSSSLRMTEPEEVELPPSPSSPALGPEEVELPASPVTPTVNEAHDQLARDIDVDDTKPAPEAKSDQHVDALKSDKLSLGQHDQRGQHPISEIRPTDTRLPPSPKVTPEQLVELPGSPDSESTPIVIDELQLHSSHDELPQSPKKVTADAHAQPSLEPPVHSMAVPSSLDMPPEDIQLPSSPADVEHREPQSPVSGHQDVKIATSHEHPAAYSPAVEAPNTKFEVPTATELEVPEVENRSSLSKQKTLAEELEELDGSGSELSRSPSPALDDQDAELPSFVGLPKDVELPSSHASPMIAPMDIQLPASPAPERALSPSPKPETDDQDKDLPITTESHEAVANVTISTWTSPTVSPKVQPENIELPPSPQHPQLLPSPNIVPGYQFSPEPISDDEGLPLSPDDEFEEEEDDDDGSPVDVEQYERSFSDDPQEGFASSPDEGTVDHVEVQHSPPPGSPAVEPAERSPSSSPASSPRISPAEVELPASPVESPTSPKFPASSSPSPESTPEDAVLSPALEAAREFPPSSPVERSVPSTKDTTFEEGAVSPAPEEESVLSPKITSADIELPSSAKSTPADAVLSPAPEVETVQFASSSEVQRPASPKIPSEDVGLPKSLLPEAEHEELELPITAAAAQLPEDVVERPQSPFETESKDITTEVPPGHELPTSTSPKTSPKEVELPMSPANIELPTSPVEEISPASEELPSSPENQVPGSPKTLPGDAGLPESQLTEAEVEEMDLAPAAEQDKERVGEQSDNDFEVSASPENVPEEVELPRSPSPAELNVDELQHLHSRQIIPPGLQRSVSPAAIPEEAQSPSSPKVIPEEVKLPASPANEATPETTEALRLPLPAELDVDEIQHLHSSQVLPLYVQRADSTWGEVVPEEVELPKLPVEEIVPEEVQMSASPKIAPEEVEIPRSPSPVEDLDVTELQHQHSTQIIPPHLQRSVSPTAQAQAVTEEIELPASPLEKSTPEEVELARSPSSVEARLDVVEMQHEHSAQILPLYVQRADSTWSEVVPEEVDLPTAPLKEITPAEVDRPVSPSPVEDELDGSKLQAAPEEVELPASEPTSPKITPEEVEVPRSPSPFDKSKITELQHLHSAQIIPRNIHYAAPSSGSPKITPEEVELPASPVEALDVDEIRRFHSSQIIPPHAERTTLPSAEGVVPEDVELPASPQIVPDAEEIEVSALPEPGFEAEPKIAPEEVELPASLVEQMDIEQLQHLHSRQIIPPHIQRSASPSVDAQVPPSPEMNPQEVELPASPEIVPQEVELPASPIDEPEQAELPILTKELEASVNQQLDGEDGARSAAHELPSSSDVKPEVQPEEMELPLSPALKPEEVDLPASPEVVPEEVELPVSPVVEMADVQHLLQPDNMPEEDVLENVNVEVPSSPAIAPEEVELPLSPKTTPDEVELPASPVAEIEEQPAAVSEPSDWSINPEANIAPQEEIELPFSPVAKPEDVELPSSPEVAPEDVELPLSPVVELEHQLPKEPVNLELPSSPKPKPEELELPPSPEIVPEEVELPASPVVELADEQLPVEPEQSAGAIEVAEEDIELPSTPIVKPEDLELPASPEVLAQDVELPPSPVTLPEDMELSPSPVIELEDKHLPVEPIDLSEVQERQGEEQLDKHTAPEDSPVLPSKDVELPASSATESEPEPIEPVRQSFDSDLFYDAVEGKGKQPATGAEELTQQGDAAKTSSAQKWELVDKVDDVDDLDSIDDTDSEISENGLLTEAPTKDNVDLRRSAGGSPVPTSTSIAAAAAAAAGAAALAPATVNELLTTTTKDDEPELRDTVEVHPAVKSAISRGFDEYDYATALSPTTVGLGLIEDPPMDLYPMDGPSPKLLSASTFPLEEAGDDGGDYFNNVELPEGAMLEELPSEAEEPAHEHASHFTHDPPSEPEEHEVKKSRKSVDETQGFETLFAPRQPMPYSSTRETLVKESPKPAAPSPSTEQTRQPPKQAEPVRHKRIRSTEPARLNNEALAASLSPRAKSSIRNSWPASTTGKAKALAASFLESSSVNRGSSPVTPRFPPSASMQQPPVSVLLKEQSQRQSRELAANYLETFADDRKVRSKSRPRQPSFFGHTAPNANRVPVPVDLDSLGEAVIPENEEPARPPSVSSVDSMGSPTGQGQAQDQSMALEMAVSYLDDEGEDVGAVPMVVTPGVGMEITPSPESSPGLQPDETTEREAEVKVAQEPEPELADEHDASPEWGRGMSLPSVEIQPATPRAVTEEEEVESLFDIPVQHVHEVETLSTVMEESEPTDEEESTPAPAHTHEAPVNDKSEHDERPPSPELPEESQITPSVEIDVGELQRLHSRQIIPPNLQRQVPSSPEIKPEEVELPSSPELHEESRDTSADIDIAQVQQLHSRQIIPPNLLHRASPPPQIKPEEIELPSSPALKPEDVELPSSPVEEIIPVAATGLVAAGLVFASEASKDKDHPGEEDEASKDKDHSVEEDENDSAPAPPPVEPYNRHVDDTFEDFYRPATPQVYPEEIELPASPEIKPQDIELPISPRVLAEEVELPSSPQLVPEEVELPSSPVNEPQDVEVAFDSESEADEQDMTTPIAEAHIPSPEEIELPSSPAIVPEHIELPSSLLKEPGDAELASASDSEAEEDTTAVEAYATKPEEVELPSSPAIEPNNIQLPSTSVEHEDVELASDSDSDSDSEADATKPEEIELPSSPAMVPEDLELPASPIVQPEQIKVPSTPEPEHEHEFHAEPEQESTTHPLLDSEAEYEEGEEDDYDPLADLLPSPDMSPPQHHERYERELPHPHPLMMHPVDYSAPQQYGHEGSEEVHTPVYTEPVEFWHSPELRYHCSPELRPADQEFASFPEVNPEDVQLPASPEFGNTEEEEEDGGLSRDVPDDEWESESGSESEDYDHDDHDDDAEHEVHQAQSVAIVAGTVAVLGGAAVVANTLKKDEKAEDRKSEEQIDSEQDESGETVSEDDEEQDRSEDEDDQVQPVAVRRGDDKRGDSEDEESDGEPGKRDGRSGDDLEDEADEEDVEDVASKPSSEGLPDPGLDRQDSETVPQAIREGAPMPWATKSKRREDSSSPPPVAQRTVSFPDDIADVAAFTVSRSNTAIEGGGDTKHGEGPAGSQATSDQSHQHQQTPSAPMSTISDYAHSYNSLPTLQEEDWPTDDDRDGDSPINKADITGLFRYGTPIMDPNRDSGFTLSARGSPQMSRYAVFNEQYHQQQLERQAQVKEEDLRERGVDLRDFANSPSAGSDRTETGPLSPLRRVQEPVPESSEDNVKEQHIPKTLPGLGVALRPTGALRSVSDISKQLQSALSGQSPSPPVARPIPSNTGVARLRSPDPPSAINLRPDSPGSSRSHTLRRMDKRATGNLRSLSFGSQQDPAAQSFPAEEEGGADPEGPSSSSPTSPASRAQPPSDTSGSSPTHHPPNQAPATPSPHTSRATGAAAPALALGTTHLLSNPSPVADGGDDNTNNDKDKQHKHAVTRPRALSVASATPVANEGRTRSRGSMDVPDAYDAGSGEGRLGSPRSPARPPSLRKRQSAQLNDLEARLAQLLAENAALQKAKNDAEAELSQRNADLASILADKNVEIENLQREIQESQATCDRLEKTCEGLKTSTSAIAVKHNETVRALEEQVKKAAEELAAAQGDREQEYSKAIAEKDAQIAHLRAQLNAQTAQIRELQQQIENHQQIARSPEPSAADDFLDLHDVDYFDQRLSQLCAHVQQWVLRFSKFSDMRHCRLTSEINDEKLIDRLDNAVLDGSDVDVYLADRVRRRDVLMSMTMTMIYEFVFTRFLFGMDRDQRQRLKYLEKQLSETGPVHAVRQWRAVTLTLLSQRRNYKSQRDRDTEAVVQAILDALDKILPPPSDKEKVILDQLRRVVREAVKLSIEMRTQRAEYIMLPPLQPEYDESGELIETVSFNAALMNERSGDVDVPSPEELERQRATVRVVLFPLVIRKGDDWGRGDDEVVVCPAQVLVQRPRKQQRSAGGRVVSGGGKAREPVSQGMKGDETMGGMGSQV